MIAIPQHSLTVPYTLSLSSIPNLLNTVASHHEATDIFARIINEDASEIKRITWGQSMVNIKDALEEIRCIGLEDKARVGILAYSNYQYYVTFMALLAGGWIPVLLSLKNSPAALEHLLTSASSNTLLVDEPNYNLGLSLSTSLPALKIYDLPVVQQSCDFDLDEDCDLQFITSDPKEVAFYLHTSGTTGHPKLVPITHKNFHEVIEGELKTPYNGMPLYASLPLFHGAGAFTFYIWPLSTGLIPTFIESTIPLNAQMVLKHVQLLPKAVIICPPSILDDIVESGIDAIKILSQCHRVFSGGATIKEETGISLTRNGVKLVNLYGMSELMGFSVRDLPSDNLLEDWRYLRFHDGYDLKFMPVDDCSDAKELLVCPGPRRSPAILNHTDPTGFCTGDLWVPHPHLEGLWKHVGRKNAITVLSNGEKTDNKQLESLLLEDEHIAQVVTFGSGRFVNGVIIKPRYPTTTRAEFLDSISSTVQHVNHTIPRHSRLLQEMILLADPNKPFLTSDKGTIKCKDTIDSYAAEIEEAYKRLESLNEEVGLSNSCNIDEVLQTLRDSVKGLSLPELSDDEDFFDHGMDSLQALKLRVVISSLAAKVNETPVTVPRDVVYRYPTFNSLAKYVIGLFNDINSGKDLSSLNADVSTELSARDRIEDVIHRFTQNFNDFSKRLRKASVILTGSTGSLGCHLLRELLDDSNVQSVHCFMRSREMHPSIKQRDVFTAHAIDADVLDRWSSKLVYHSVDIGKDDFGLDDTTLSQLRDSVTHVVHAAWNLNFNLNLSHFESTYISSVRHLIDFCLSSPRSEPPRLIFFSSVAAVGNLPESELVPECHISCPDTPFGMGYAQSKFACERILDAAAAFGLRYTVIRCGQLSGSSESGRWNSREWMPMMIQSCKALGAVPDNLEPVHWLPVDVAARLVIPMLDLCNHINDPACYFHLQNPDETSWREVVDSIAHRLPDIRRLPLSEWLRELETSYSPDSPLTLPALKLFNYLKSKLNSVGTMKMEVTQTIRLVPEMQYGPITAEVMQKYIAAAIVEQI